MAQCTRLRRPGDVEKIKRETLHFLNNVGSRAICSGKKNKKKKKTRTRWSRHEKDTRIKTLQRKRDVS